MPSGWKHWNQDDYHPNFARRALWRKKCVKYTCEKCGARRGDRRLNKSGRLYKVMVAAAHVNHDPGNARAKLIILCQVCHLEHDAFEHAKKASQTWKRKEREKKIQSGQLELPLKYKKPRKRRSA